eukprot:m.41654 g.41654  ORF g.41654 m.41654 type:complete len:61 (+) comp6052_c0_seq3:24-206(+)
MFTTQCRYQPTIPVEFVQKLLQFESDKACHKFLLENFVVLKQGNHALIDCKATAKSMAKA